MAAKQKKNGKKKVTDTVDEFHEPLVSSAAMKGVGAIFLIALAGFLVLAQLGGGGTVGSYSYEFFSWLLGVGYELLPLSLFLTSIALFRSFSKTYGWVHAASMAIFLLSSLGLVNLAFAGQGGILGSFISTPIVHAVDTTATVFFLFSFLIASLVIAFDIHLGNLVAGLYDMTLQKFEPSTLDVPEQEMSDVPVSGLPVEHEEVPAEDTPAAEEDTEEAVPKSRKATITDSNANDPANVGFPITATLDSTYTFPPTSLLAKNKGKPDVGDVKANMNIIKRTLLNFGIQVEMDEAVIGPTVTRYSMKPAEGVRLSKIVALQSNMELALAASPIRIEAPIPGKSLVGVEVPNIARTTLGLGPLVTDEAYTSSTKPLLMALGRSITGQANFADLTKMPHMLIAGTTGSGKSVTIHDFVVSLLYRCGPERLRFIMVDPKRVELTLYKSIPHLLTPVITDAKKAILALKWLAKEMDRRYNVLETESVRDIASYHLNVVAPAVEKAAKEAAHSTSSPLRSSSGGQAGQAAKPLPEAMPYIVLIIDELADIMQTYPRELESGIVRLAQMSRAVGIHLILSTQRPSVKVITGLIKANIPARVALQVASQIDSRTILDMSGAEKLLGAGDTLFLSGDMAKPMRIQAPYITEDEVKKVVAFIAKQAADTLPNEINLDESAQRANDPIFSSMTNDPDASDDDDELYGEAKKTVIEAGKASTSYLQRKLGVGYARAARLMDILEERGVIGPADGAKPRDVIGAGNADELAKEPAESAEENTDA